MPDIYGGNPAEVVANGVRVVKLDPVATMLAPGLSMTSPVEAVSATCPASAGPSSSGMRYWLSSRLS